MNNPTPAQQLFGKKLVNGWEVREIIPRSSNATGGHFSTSYIVHSSSGDSAFLKAMDFKKALESPDPARALQTMTAAYNFERALLEKCMSNNLSRIVRVLDSGILAAQNRDPSSVVQYLIFELADGDIRSFVDFGRSFDNGWILRTMHQTSAALQQLHNVQIAHQDLKPSNVLVFDEYRSKLADLGRAFDRGSTSPFDEYRCAGDLTYAPPELLYGHLHEDWRVRRFACDLYLLGSLLVYFYTGVSITHMLFKRLDENHHYKTFTGTYGEVLPYLQHIFSQVIRELREQIPTDFAEEIKAVAKQLCDPDPQKRGHPKNVIYRGNQFSLERYVSKFDLLAKRAMSSSLRLLGAG